MNEDKIGHTASCLDIETLLEKQAAEDPLTEREREVLGRHLAVCRDCGDFSKILFGMSALSDAFSPEAEPGNDTGSPGSYPRDAVRPFFYTGRFWKFAAVASVTAAASFFFILNALNRNVATDNPDSRTPTCTPTPPVVLAEGIRMSSCEGSAVRSVVEASGTLRLSLDSGAVGLSAEPGRRNKHPLVVSCAFGEVWVKGTVLSVHVTEEDARVEVFRGVVEVRPSSSRGGSFEVPEGRAAALSGMQPFVPNARWGEPLSRRLEQNQEERESTQADKAPAGDIASDSDIGIPPLAASADMEMGKEGGGKFRTPLKGQSVESRIQRAQFCLIDKDWNCAAAEYRQIIRDYPSGAESASAYISLAKIELRRLGRPEKALRYFSAYKTRLPKGPLTEEAILGIAESHRALHNPEKEAAALNELLTRFPKSASASTAEARLQKIRLK